MKDERRLCANCNHEHAWGILRHSIDGVPLYGPRRCSCSCDRFVEKQEGMENLPSLTNDEVKELWAKTSFLNAQVPMATRIAVKQIIESGKGAEGSYFSRLLGGGGKTAMERQWPEFMGLMISQLTDMRGAMTRDENKFAHLVAHTDEIVEAMRGVVQLKERLDTMYQVQERILDALDRLGDKLMESKEVSEKEAARVFAAKSRPLWNEPIVTDSDELCPDCASSNNSD